MGIDKRYLIEFNLKAVRYVPPHRTLTGHCFGPRLQSKLKDVGPQVFYIKTDLKGI
jgi:hypothetical protein